MQHAYSINYNTRNQTRDTAVTLNTYKSQILLKK